MADPTAGVPPAALPPPRWYTPAGQFPPRGQPPTRMPLSAAPGTPILRVLIQDMPPMVGPRRPSASTAVGPQSAPQMLGLPAPRLSANLRRHCIHGEHVAGPCGCPTHVTVNAVTPMRVLRLLPSASLCGPQSQGSAGCPPAPGYVHTAQPPNPPTITEPPTEQRPPPHCWYARTFHTKLHVPLVAPRWGPIPRSPLSRGLMLPPHQT